MLDSVIDRILDDRDAPDVRRHVGTLIVARLAGNSCYRFAPPFLATIARGIDVSLDQIGIALAISELCGLFSPLTARLVDRMSRRTGMVLGLLGITAGTVLAASSQGLVLFAVALVVLGQSKVLFDLGMGAWIADHVPYQRRSRIVGITETSWAFGLLIGVSAMGLITAATNWRVGYLVGAAGALVMGSVIAKQLSSERAPAELAANSAAADVRGSTGSIGTRGWLVVGGICTLMAASQSLFVTFGSWLEDAFDFRPAALAAVAFGLGLGELVASITSARGTDRWGKERSTAIGALLMVPSGLALVVWHDHVAVGMLFLVVAICGFEFAIVSVIAIGSTLVPGSPARGLGMMLAGGTMGRALAAIPATRLYESRGMGWPAMLSAAFASCTVVAMTLAKRHATRPN